MALAITKDRSLLLDPYLPGYTSPSGEEWILQADAEGFGKPNDYTPTNGDEAGVEKHAYWVFLYNFILPSGAEDPSSCHKWARCRAILASSGDYIKNGYIRVCIPTSAYNMAMQACAADDGTCLAPKPKYQDETYTTVFVKLRNWRQSEGKPGDTGTKYLLSVANQMNVQEMELKSLQAQARKDGKHVGGTMQFRFSLVVHTPKGDVVDTLGSVRAEHRCVLNMVVTQFAAEDMLEVPSMDVGASSEACAAIMPKTSANILAAVAAAGITLPAIAASAPSR